MSEDSIISKPFLKWAGGKSKLVPILNEYLGQEGRLVEPFVGSGAVFMGTTFKKYLLCDTNADLIGLFVNLKSHKAALIKEADSLFKPKFNTETAFYELRLEFNSLASHELRKSAIFIYLNKHAFNGLCRYNSKGQFNVPYGRYHAPSFPLKEIELFAQKSELADFKCLDFVDAFSQVKPGDVVYCDPPYVPLSKTASFTAYAKGDFNDENQRELAKQALLLKEKGIRVVISNHDTEFTREIYKKANLIQIDVRRSISSKASTRGETKEIIAVF